jgi:hypothetical protein
MTTVRPLSEATYQWVARTHAFHAGEEFIRRRNDPVAMRRWWLDHGHAPGLATAVADDLHGHAAFNRFAGLELIPPEEVAGFVNRCGAG